MKLLNYWRSSSSWRVRIALAHKNLAYEYVPVHLVEDGGAQNKDWFVEINPSAPMRRGPMYLEASLTCTLYRVVSFQFVR